MVHDPDDVHFVVAGASRSLLMHRLARRLEGDVDIQLWDRDAARFRLLLGAGDAAGAVEHYFRRVGIRWDRARLRLETVSLTPGEAD